MSVTTRTEQRRRVFSVEGASGSAWLTVARPVLDRVLGLSRLQRYYEQRPPASGASTFLDWSLRKLDVEVCHARTDVEHVPAEGPVIVVANHPFGGIEGLVLARLLLERRPDVRVMANYVLGRIPEIRELFLFVDPFETRDAVRRNLVSTRRALRWLHDGGLLAVFPAGEVAHFRADTRRIEDPEWSPIVAGFVRRARCPVVPVHFTGRNSLGFQAAGWLHPRLRTAMLARELLGRRGRPIEVRVGRPVPFRRLEDFEDDRGRIDYLRRRTEILAERPPLAQAAVQPRVTPANAVPIAAPVPVDVLEREIGRLPEEALLVDGDDQVVYVAAAERIPAVLRDIGRLRELTFREVGEGTGRELDLDEFDPHYRHLFIWSRADRRLVGAYRLGLTDERLASGGPRALYTSTLFRYERPLFEAMGPAIEMGRSWVRPEYQKSYHGLMLLWKGIGRFAVRHPRYGTMFGPVSISADYRSASQRLIVAFLEQNRYVHEWSEWVRPRQPHRPDRRTGSRLSPLQLRDLEDVSAFIAEIEADHKGVPILLKQYLKLGGRLLGFNVDPAFNNVLDVLILVDLRRTDTRILGRYMGRDGVASFRAHHRDLATRASGQ